MILIFASSPASRSRFAHCNNGQYSLSSSIAQAGKVSGFIISNVFGRSDAIYRAIFCYHYCCFGYEMNCCFGYEMNHSMTYANRSRLVSLSFFAILLISVLVKLYAAQLLAWEVDYVPVVARGQAWLDGGDFPVVGTLSSVAAHNMPFLVWLQLPALLISRDVRFVLVITQLLFNLLGSWAVFRLGSRLFCHWSGMMAALLFTFSDIGISSAYTAWAQLLLPSFFALVAYFLFLWKLENRSWQVALVWITATAAFMTHFSAVLLYVVILVLALILRLPLNWRGLAAGFLVSAAMLAPYMFYQSHINFVDLKAFFTRGSRVSSQILAEVAHLKPEAQAVTSTDGADLEQSDTGEVSPARAPASSRLERGLIWILSMPGQFLISLQLIFRTDLLSLKKHQPDLYLLSSMLRVSLAAIYWFGILQTLYSNARRWWIVSAQSRQQWEGLARYWRVVAQSLINTASGRNLALLLFVLGISAGLILTRASPEQQPSYYTGLISLQFIICSYVFCIFGGRQRIRILIVMLMMIHVCLGVGDRILRVSHHDPAIHSPLNLSLYSNIDDTTRWIASDWQTEKPINISYDLMPELSYQWWVVAWHTIDESYRIGMAFDYLLHSYYDLELVNHNPGGIAEDPDYVVTSAPGLERYDLAHYHLEQFGALYALKPDRD